MRRPALLVLLAAALLAAACRTGEPPATSWEDHAVRTWADKLADDDPWVRAGAADALGRLGPVAGDSAKPLLQRLHEDESVEVRARSARALGLIGATSAKPALLELLRSPEDVRVRGAAAGGLIALGAGEELLELLLAGLDARPDAENLQAIAHGFSALGTAAVAPLRQRLSPAAPDESRRAAALCLGQVGPPARPAAAQVAVLLDEADGNLRLAAMLALGNIGGDEACRALARAAGADPEPALRLEALIAGAESCEIEAVDD